VTPDHETQLVRVAEMYYEGDRTQEQIARELHVTRWKVGRLLAEARDVGIVRIQIVHPRARKHGAERALIDRYGLRDAVVVPAEPGDDAASAEAVTRLRDRVARAGADYLATLRPSPRLLCVSWGRTLDALAAHVPAGWATGVHVVQMNGSLSRSRRPTSASDMASRIAHSGSGTVTLLPVPAIVERADTRMALDGDRAVSDVLGLARSADCYLFSTGSMDPGSVLVESGYLSAADVTELAGRGAVGDVASRFITAEGRIADPELDARTLGLGPSDLCSGARSIAVVAGRGKHQACHAVVAAGVCNVLVTDEATSRYLLEDRR
jgi:deoxyribonucleoside regulator